MLRVVGKFVPIILGIFLLCPVLSQGQTVKKELIQRLDNAGVENSDSIVGHIESQTGTYLNVPLNDRVDFASFPDARLNLNRLKAPAALVLSPSAVNYVFQGKPDSFQGSFRSYEFHLGKGLQKSSFMIYPQVFETIRATGDIRNAGKNEVTVLPELTEFRFRWGGTFTPVMYVDMKIKVTLHYSGVSIFQKTYEVKDIKEGTGNLFPNDKQEYRAISRAFLETLGQSAQDIAGLPVLLAYKPPGAETAPAVKMEKIDMDAILFLADTWKKYRENKSRLTLTEQKVAVRLLRLKHAQDTRDIDLQQKQIAALIKEAKKLTPVSKAELLEEIKYNKTDTDNQLIERNRKEDAFYNFAGNYTEDVLDYAGLGIDLAKVTVLAAGCLADPVVTCPALASTMSGWDMAGTVAEGFGAAIEEVAWKSGDVTEALYQGAKASLIDYTAGRLTGELSEAVTGKLAHKVSRNIAQSSARGATNEMAETIRDRVYVNWMEILYRAPSAGAASVSKDLAKRIEAGTEEMIFSTETEEKALNNTIGNRAEAQSISVDFQSLNEL